MVSEWIDLNESKPDCDQWVLCLGSSKEIGDPPHAVACYKYYKGLKYCGFEYLSSGCGCCDTSMENVTHWMPLPSAPKHNEPVSEGK